MSEYALTIVCNCLDFVNFRDGTISNIKENFDRRFHFEIFFKRKIGSITTRMVENGPKEKRMGKRGSFFPSRSQRNDSNSFVVFASATPYRKNHLTVASLLSLPRLTSSRLGKPVLELDVSHFEKFENSN